MVGLCRFLSFGFTSSQNFASLSKHMKVHGRKSGNVVKHHHQCHHIQVEGDVQLIRHIQTHESRVPQERQTVIVTPELTRHPHGIQDDKESVTKPGENGDIDLTKSHRVVRVTDNFCNTPSREHDADARGHLRVLDVVDGEPQDRQSTEN